MKPIFVTALALSVMWAAMACDSGESSNSAPPTESPENISNAALQTSTPTAAAVIETSTPTTVPSPTSEPATPTPAPVSTVTAASPAPTQIVVAAPTATQISSTSTPVPLEMATPSPTIAPTPTVGIVATLAPTSTPTTESKVECVVNGYAEAMKRIQEMSQSGGGFTELNSKPRENADTYTHCGVAYDGVSSLPRLATASYVELDAVSMVSKFRAHAGHDFSDSYEDCRTMKHYSYFRDGLSYGSLPIYSPIDGVIAMIQDEGLTEGSHGGWQMYIVSSVDPSFVFRLFHMKPMPGYLPGKVVKAGEMVGVNNDTNYTNDIAVQATTKEGTMFLSYFELMTDEVFSLYGARGMISREDAVISASDRDATPLTCDGEWYTERTADFGDPSAWITLN